MSSDLAPYTPLSVLRVSDRRPHKSLHRNHFDIRIQRSLLRYADDYHSWTGAVGCINCASLQHDAVSDWQIFDYGRLWITFQYLLGSLRSLGWVFRLPNYFVKFAFHRFDNTLQEGLHLVPQVFTGLRFVSRYFRIVSSLNNGQRTGQMKAEARGCQWSDSLD